ncbi:MAG: CYTH domain-containing protein [Pirellulaceae bacterium]
MPKEIERKFLTVSDAWRTSDPVYYCQGYLNRDKQRTVRVRVAGELAMLTIKGVTTGMTRDEYEYPIPLQDAKNLLQLCHQPLIEKNRSLVEHHGLTFEVDEFLGLNKGLVVAEVELASEDQVVDLPPWIGKEVTDDPRYFNSALSSCPFTTWPDAS